MKNATFSITGMHCNGCANIVQSLLERQAGVKSVKVSFADGRARVLFEPQTVSEAVLVATIEKAGYQVTSAVLT